MKTKEELRLYFENGDKPTQEHFWQWQDSYWHKDEIVERVIPLMIEDTLWGYSRSVSIPKNIKKIRQFAFQYASMDSQIFEIIFNEGLEEIGRSAFQYQDIRKIKTPSTLRIIENGAFDNQGSQTDGTLLSMEEIILNEGLLRIGDYAFNCSRASVKNLYIPSSVEFIGQNAFAIPSLQTVSAPAGLDLSKAGIPAAAIITYR